MKFWQASLIAAGGAALVAPFIGYALGDGLPAYAVIIVASFANGMTTPFWLMRQFGGSR